MRIKHFGIFKKNTRKIDWENLRNDENERPYFLPYDKESYLKKVDVDTPTWLTVKILEEVKKTGLSKIFSIGSGVAAQEFQLKKFSDFSVVVSDYNSSVLRLKQFEIFDDALRFDAFNDPLTADKYWLVIFPRIDTEFDDEQLDKVFDKCRMSGIEHICFIPAELLNLRIFMAEIKVKLIGLLKHKPLTFCGYARSLHSFKKIWGPYYNMTEKYTNGNKHLFILKAKN